MNAIAASSVAISSVSGGDSLGKEASSSFRASSAASLLIWLGSLFGLALVNWSIRARWLVLSSIASRSIVGSRVRLWRSVSWSCGRFSSSPRTIVLYRILASFGFRGGGQVGVRREKPAFD
jgi:hypothetical protein